MPFGGTKVGALKRVLHREKPKGALVRAFGCVNDAEGRLAKLRAPASCSAISAAELYPSA
jgi:hypothetical protein